MAISQMTLLFDLEHPLTTEDRILVGRLIEAALRPWLRERDKRYQERVSIPGLGDAVTTHGAAPGAPLEALGEALVEAGLPVEIPIPTVTHSSALDQQASDHFGLQRIPRCALDDCQEPVLYTRGGVAMPYCHDHESQFRWEWTLCAECLPIVRRVAYLEGQRCTCSLHGGTDYQPRRTLPPAPSTRWDVVSIRQFAQAAEMSFDQVTHASDALGFALGRMTAAMQAAGEDMAQRLDQQIAAQILPSRLTSSEPWTVATLQARLEAYLTVGEGGHAGLPALTAEIRSRLAVGVVLQGLTYQTLRSGTYLAATLGEGEVVLAYRPPPRYAGVQQWSGPQAAGLPPVGRGP